MWAQGREKRTENVDLEINTVVIPKAESDSIFSLYV